METLEERGLLAIFGLPWPDPGHLTLSFAPDGTNVGGAPNALYQTLDPKLANVWQTTVLRAFQSWAAKANINIGVVSDNGQPFGQPGPLQGNPGAGDIRIAARPLSADTLALATPFDLFNSWAGDVLLNSNARFGNGSNGTQDLFDAALHEAGHVFGLDDNPNDPTSALYTQDLGNKTGPSASDIAALQALYGTRQADPGGVSSFGKATTVPYVTTAGPGKLAAPGAIAGGLSGATDREFYALTVPASAGGSFVVTLRASGLSLVTPKVTVFDALGQVVGSSVAADPLHNDLTVTIPASMPGANFYARVEASGPGAGVFAYGSYRIAAGAPLLARDAAATPAVTNASLNPNGNRNDEIGSPTNLKPQGDVNSPGWPYTVRAGLNNPTDVNFYKFKTDDSTPHVMLVTVWGLQPNGLTPRLDVCDNRGNPVASQLVSRNANTYTLQVPNVDDSSGYHVRVAALDPSGGHATGNYFLGIAFRNTTIVEQPFADGVLGASKTQDFRTLTVASSGLFHFDLSATGGSPTDTAVRATFYDSNKTLVSTFNTVNGSADVLLGPGTYTVRFVAGTKSGAPLPTLHYSLRGMVRSDPIGPGVTDTTLYPTSPSPTTAPTSTYVWTTYDYLTYVSYLSLTGPGSLPY